MQLSNVKQALSTGESVFLSVYIQTEVSTYSFPLTREGLTAAAPYWREFKNLILSEEEENEDYKISLFMDDGESEIRFLSSSELTREQYCLWKEFTDTRDFQYSLEINGNFYRFEKYRQLRTYLANILNERCLLEEWHLSGRNFLQYCRDVLDCSIVES